MQSTILLAFLVARAHFWLMFNFVFVKHFLSAHLSSLSRTSGWQHNTVMKCLYPVLCHLQLCWVNPLLHHPHSEWRWEHDCTQCWPSGITCYWSTKHLHPLDPDIQLFFSLPYCSCNSHFRHVQAYWLSLIKQGYHLVYLQTVVWMNNIHFPVF